MPSSLPDKPVDVAKDLLYVSVGLSVIAFQKLQVRRQELRKELNRTLEATRTQIEDRVKTIEERLSR